MSTFGFSQAASKANKFNSFSNNGGDVWLCGNYLLALGQIYTPTTVNVKWGSVDAINKTLTKTKVYFIGLKNKTLGQVLSLQILHKVQLILVVNVINMS